jgi:ABC-type glutathione transport system ATPase component
METETRFELKNVSKFYTKNIRTGKKVRLSALDSVDLRIYEKKINGLMGKSGCGKSTLARILLGLESYDTGDIIYKGKNIESTSKREFRRKNQVMFQNPFLSVNPYFKIQKILSEPLIINKRFNKKQINKKIEHLLEILEIPGCILNRYPSELSGGQLQRIVLGRTLVLEPEFIVLDEPFSSLDEIMAARLMHYFKKIFDQLGIGILYISHHLKRVQFLADYVALMEKGRVIQHVAKEEFKSF